MTASGARRDFKGNDDVRLAVCPEDQIGVPPSDRTGSCAVENPLGWHCRGVSAAADQVFADFKASSLLADAGRLGGRQTQRNRPNMRGPSWFGRCQKGKGLLRLSNAGYPRGVWKKQVVPSVKTASLTCIRWRTVPGRSSAGFVARLARPVVTSGPR